MAYTKATDFAVKDSLPSGTAAKIIKGTELDNEFNAIETDLALKAPLASPTFTGTVTVPTPGSADSATPKSYVDALALGGTVGLVGMGGQVITGSVTLTSSSDAAISVTPASPGLYVTLPDATTLYESVRNYSIANLGDHDYGIKDSAGTQLGWVRPKTGAVLGLADKSTTAGSWILANVVKSGVTAQLANNTVASSNSMKRIALDATRTLFLLGTTSVYAVVYDSSTTTWGSPVLVRASIGSGQYQGVLSATDQVLVASCTSTTGFEIVALTISGTTVTVNTAATATLGGNITNIHQFIAVGTSFVICYVRATTTTGIRAITVSGTTVTIGAESTINTLAATNSQVPMLFASGSVVRTICATADNTTFRCAPYTVSGSTLSVGTGVNVTTTNTAQNSARSFVNGNGNIVFYYVNTNFVATVFKLTATTEAASTVTVSATTPTTFLSGSDHGVISASKTAIAFAGLVNIVTDTAGTATAGTAITVGSDATNVLVNVSGNNVTFANNADTVYTVDCSGTSPVLTSAYGANSASVSSPSSKDSYGVKAPSSLYAGSTLYATGVTGSFDRIYTTGGWYRTPILHLVATPTISGAANNESWITASRGSGCVVQRIEVAA